MHTLHVDRYIFIKFFFCCAWRIIFNVKQKKVTRNYSVSVQIGDHQYGGTSYRLWFGLKGSTDDSTQWFSYCCFDTPDTTYNLNVVLNDVGNITEATILNRFGDGVYVRAFTIDNYLTHTFTNTNWGVLIKNTGSGPQYDSCGFANINFVNGLSTDDTSTPCPYLTEYSFPTTEPTLAPS